MNKVYIILIGLIGVLFLINTNIARASSECQSDYSRINELKIELANLQEQYVGGQIEKEIQAKYPGSPYNDAMIAAKYKEGADKEALLIVQINKQIAIYQTCINNAKETARIEMDNAKTEMDNAKSSFAQTCYNMNAVPNSSNTNCECVIGTSYSTSAGKCISQKKETTVNSCSNIVNGYIGIDNKCYCKLGYSWNTTENSCKENNSITSILRLKAQVQFDKYKKQYSQYIQSVQKSKYQTLLATLQKKTKKLKGDNQKINNLIIELITIEVGKL